VRLAAAAAGSVTLLGVVLAWGADPDRVEHTFVPVVGPAVTWVPQQLTRIVPTSVAEWLEVAAIVAAVAWIVTTGRRWWKGRGERTTIALRAGLWVILALAWTALVFYTSWGLAYGRPPLEQRLGWPTTDELDLSVAELERLSIDLVDHVNGLYLALHGWPDGWRPTPAPRGLAAADRAVDVGWARAATALGLEAQAGRSRGPVKPLLTSPVFSVLGLGGFYFPFTGEANINADVPEWQLPHTMAHEKAHQRFVAPENEANFMGFLACISAPDTFVNYSGWLFAQRQALRALGHADPVRFTDLIVRRLPGVQRDVDFSRAFWERYEGPIGDLSDQINDAYLRANAVEGGIQSYSRSLELYVEWVRAGRPGGSW
jgi:hypothetical protein